MSRQIVLDTETTGLHAHKGDRIIEVGCVEVVNRKITGKEMHFYCNPNRHVDDEAIEIHGITNEFLADKLSFSDHADALWDFLEGAELVIHNAAFDIGFLNMEFKQFWKRPADFNHTHAILDTLLMARKKHHGMRNNLDALCKRYNIDLSARFFSPYVFIKIQ